jgi:hypothetical protein
MNGINLKWLSLTLSARGLARELSHYVDDEGVIRLRADALVDAVTIGNEIARLLCAHRHEHARVRADVKALLDSGKLVIEVAGLRLCEAANSTAVHIESGRALSPSAERMRRHRERHQASLRDARDPSHVTPDTVTGDASSDVGDASRALSLKNDLNFKSKRESAGARKAHEPIPPDLPLSESARAKAVSLGLQDADLIWTGFVAHYVASAKRCADWDAMWTTWVTREASWRRRKGSPNEPRRGPIVQRADMNAPWLRAMGES